MEVAKAVQGLCSKTVAGRSGALSMNWIQGIPIFSFLAERSEPYDDVRNMSRDKLVSNWHFLTQECKLNEARRHIKNVNLK